MQFEVHIKESPFLKVRKGPIVVLLDGKPFASLDGSTYRRAEKDSEAWSLVVPIAMPYPVGSYGVAFQTVPRIVRAYLGIERLEVMTLIEEGHISRLRTRGTEWMDVYKMKSGLVRIVDGSGAQLGEFRKVDDRPSSKPDLDGVGTITDNRSDFEIDAFVLTFLRLAYHEPEPFV